MSESRSRGWEVTAEKVDAAVQRIIEVARPLKVILFGSYVRNDISTNSDADFLVITGDDVENARKESVRIRRALRGIAMPMDILVVPEGKWRQLKDKPGLIYREAFKNGRVVYEASR